MNAENTLLQAALIAERDAIWARVTGYECTGPNHAATVAIHGITPDEIRRVARINAELTRLRYADRWGV